MQSLPAAPQAPVERPLLVRAESLALADRKSLARVAGRALVVRTVPADELARVAGQALTVVPAARPEQAAVVMLAERRLAAVARRSAAVALAAAEPDSMPAALERAARARVARQEGATRPVHSRTRPGLA